MSEATTQVSQTQFDVSKAIDDGGFTLLQKMAYLFAALAIVVDGFDGQMIGYAIPVIIKEWGVTRAAFSIAVASGLMGMAIGSLSAGVLSDKVGRKPVLIGSIFIFRTRRYYHCDDSLFCRLRYWCGFTCSDDINR